MKVTIESVYEGKRRKKVQESVNEGKKSLEVRSDLCNPILLPLKDIK